MSDINVVVKQNEITVISDRNVSLAGIQGIQGEQGIPGGNITNASELPFTPTGSLSSTNVQTALDELDSEKAGKLFATNSVTNGDFSNGKTGWAGSNSTISGLDNTLLITGNGTASNPRVYQVDIFDLSKKYHTKLKVRVTNANCLFLNIYVGSDNVVIATIQNPVQNQWYDISNVITSLGIAKRAIYISHEYADSATANGKVMEVQGVHAINLTTLFGAGNEPTKEQMDWIFTERDRLGLGHLNGTQELLPMVSLLNLINKKANIAQEAWITPTLLNGWTNFEPNGYALCQYYKDEMGIVHARGFIKGGTIGSTIFTFPPGYRVTKNQYFTAYSNDSLAQMTLGSGDLKCRIGNNTYVSFYIHFRAEA